VDQHGTHRYSGIMMKSGRWIFSVRGELTTRRGLVELVSEEDVCFFSEDVTEPIGGSARSLLIVKSGVR
jgi:hypothetical protein